MARTQRRRGSFPMFLVFSVTMAVIMTQAQPQHFFKANAPVSKSLPRIGKRNDAETFPMPLPILLSDSSSRQGENNNWQGDIGGGLRRDGEEGFIIPFLEDDHPPVQQPNSLQVGQFLWRKLMGEPDPSTEIRTYPSSSSLSMDGGGIRNMYRSRTRK